MVAGGGRDFPPSMSLDMSELAQLRLDLGDVVTTLSQATDDLYRSLAGANVEDARQLLIQVSVDVAEAGRTATKAWTGVRDVIRALDAHREVLAADERADDVPPTF